MQAIRIPPDSIAGEDERLIIEPAPARSLLAILPSLDEKFPSLEDRPPQPADL
jgi:virulence-associated protein VagC